MIPTLRLVWLATLGFPLTLLALLGDQGRWAAAVYWVILLGAILVDRALTESAKRIDANRVVPARWTQGRSTKVGLELAWGGRRRARLRVRDLPPTSFAVDGAVFGVQVAPAATGRIEYEAVPLERGSHHFGPIVVRSIGPLGLIERQAVHPFETAVRVYPDLIPRTLAERAALGPTTRIVGTRRTRVHGEGREFYQLRNYLEGDDVRLMDWKGFARHGRPAVREYRSERNQRIVLMLDAGRLMTFRVADRLRFDWAVQAAGRLAQAALANGDQVGLTVYSSSIKAQLPAARRTGQLLRVSELLCDARPDLDEPDLGGAIGALLRSNPRRTLVVVFTEIADPRAAEQVLRHVGTLAPRHLGLVVTLADADLLAERRLEIVDGASVYRRVAADELWQEYRRTELALERRGSLVLRARADALAAETLSRYAEIKRRALL